MIEENEAPQGDTDTPPVGGDSTFLTAAEQKIAALELKVSELESEVEKLAEKVEKTFNSYIKKLFHPSEW